MPYVMSESGAHQLARLPQGAVWQCGQVQHSLNETASDLVRRLEAGQMVTCPRCGLVLVAIDGLWGEEGELFEFPF